MVIEQREWNIGLRNRVHLLMVSLVIAIVAALVRVPSCHESFWVDELHTAWTIHDGFAEVLPRAQAGHQQPYYFGVLWVWRQAFGESEVALRLSSVIAVVAAAVWLTIAVARSSQSLLAGMAAGMFLAVESNSIFFGTELRPYAVVIFASVLSCDLAQRSWAIRPSERGRAWVLLFVAMGVAGMMQLTSLGILAWLPVSVITRWCWIDWREMTRPRWVDAWASVVVVVLGVLLMPQHVMDTWNSRSIWANFASTRYIDDWWELWPWLVGAVLPAVWLAGWSIARGSSASAGDSSWAVVLLVITVGTSLLFWIVSYAGIAPLWHRRFMIAGLPMLAWFFGFAIGSRAGQGTLEDRWQFGLSASLLVLLLVMLTSWSQLTLPKLLRYRRQLVGRGEDWRGAVEYLNAHTNSNDRVFIDPGLIEQVGWHREIVSSTLPQDQVVYLAYPLRGVYELKHDSNVLASNLAPLNGWMGSHDRVWIISRSPVNRLKQRVLQLQKAGTSDDRNASIDFRSYGGVSIALIESDAR